MSTIIKQWNVAMEGLRAIFWALGSLGVIVGFIGMIVLLFQIKDWNVPIPKEQNPMGLVLCGLWMLVLTSCVPTI